jgi:glycosyltransferase involved in cell wall biosynthesis
LNKLKIIFCTDGIFPHQVGGMQRHSRILIEHLSKMDQLQLIVIHPHSEKIFQTNTTLTEVLISPIDTSKNYLKECYTYSKRVYEVIQKHPDAIVYSQGLSVWYHIKKINAPVIINPHGLEPYQSISLKDRIVSIPFKLIFNNLFNQADGIISLGGKLTDIIRRRVKNKDKIIVIPNAVTMPDLPSKRQWNQKLKLLFVARFAHNKGIHILLEAIKQLNSEGYEDKLEFNLGGKGPLFEQYSSSLTYKNVNYLGFVSDEQLINLYTTNDLFVFPTLFEGMPTVVLEAMSYGMPVIVSDVGATSELVNSSNGYLITKNNVQELKDTIKFFCDLPITEKEQLSVNARIHVERNFTWKNTAAQYIGLFQQMK